MIYKQKTFKLTFKAENGDVFDDNYIHIEATCVYPKCRRITKGKEVEY